MRIALTGAAGLTGGAVVEALAARGHEVRALVRRGITVPAASTTVQVDIRDKAGMERALTDVDALVHLAGVHLGETIAQLAGVRVLRRVVVMSTAGIYSAHRSSRALYVRNEESLRLARPDVMLIRPTMIYGSARDRNLHHVIDFARRWRFLPIPGGGSSLIQPVHYRDLAAATAVLTEGPATGVVDVGGGNAVTLREAATAIFEALGRPARLLRIPLGAAIPTARAIDAIRGTRWLERIERTLEDRSVDNTRLVELTQIRPRELIDGLRQQLDDTAGK